MKRGIQLLLDNGTIMVSGHRDDYHGINAIEDCLAAIESDDEYASANELFSSDEDMFSSDDSVMTKYSEEGVNIIVPYFNDSSPVEIEYCSKPVVAPLVICLLGPVSYKSDKVVSYKYNATILEDGVEVPIHPLSNFAEASRVTRTGRMFAPVIRGNASAD